MSNKLENSVRSFSASVFAISVILAIVYLISGFTAASYAADLVDWRDETTVYLTTLVPYLITSASIGVIGFFLFLLINLIVGIHENTRKIAELLDNTAPNSSVFKNINIDKKPTSNLNISVNETPSKDEWRCPSCKRIHKNYVTTCPCGQEKNKNS